MPRRLNLRWVADFLDEVRLHCSSRWTRCTRSAVEKYVESTRTVVPELKKQPVVQLGPAMSSAGGPANLAGRSNDSGGADRSGALAGDFFGVLFQVCFFLPKARRVLTFNRASARNLRTRNTRSFVTKQGNDRCSN